MTQGEPFQDNGGNVVADRVAALTEQARGLVDADFDFYYPIAKDLAVLEGSDSDIWAELTQRVLDCKDSTGGILGFDKTQELKHLASGLAAVGGREQAIQLAKLVDAPLEKATVLSYVAEAEGAESDLWSGIVEAVAGAEHPSESDSEAFSTFRMQLEDILHRATSASPVIATEIFEVIHSEDDVILAAYVIDDLCNAHIKNGNAEAALEVAKEHYQAIVDQGYSPRQERDARRIVKCLMLVGQEAEAQTLIDQIYPEDFKRQQRYGLLAEIAGAKQAQASEAIDLSVFRDLFEAARISDEPGYAMERIAVVVAQGGDFDEAVRLWRETRASYRFEHSDAAFEFCELLTDKAVTEGSFEEAMDWQDYSEQGKTYNEVDVRERMGKEAVRKGDLATAMSHVEALAAMDDGSRLGYTIPNTVSSIARRVLSTTGDLSTVLDMVSKIQNPDLQLMYGLKVAAAHKLLQST